MCCNNLYLYILQVATVLYYTISLRRTAVKGIRLNPSVMRFLWFGSLKLHILRGNNLFNTTCLTQVFFKSGEECSKVIMVILDTINDE